MKLIIDISEGVYKHIDTIQNGSIGAKQIINSVKNGIPTYKAIPSVDENEWIPCSEQLPKKNGRYWCTVGTNYRNPREMYYVPKGKNNRTWASLDREYVEDCFVIAWMPLPEPYKAESEETETWNGFHGQITAPKGTFEQIFNDTDDDNDI